MLKAGFVFILFYLADLAILPFSLNSVIFFISAQYYSIYRYLQLLAILPFFVNGLSGTINFQKNFDGLVRNPKVLIFVIPATCRAVALAKAEGRNPVFSKTSKNPWTPFSNGVTTFYEIVNFGIYSL
jgi:hypothetical protein